MKQISKQLFIFILSLGFIFFNLFYLSSIHNISFKQVPLVNDLKFKSSDPAYWPTSGWRSSLPGDQGVAISKLREMEVFIENYNIRHYIDSLLIIRNGYIVYEKYPSGSYHQNRRHHIFSCTKVFISALIGVAIEENYISGVDEHVLDFFPNKTFANLDSQKEAITIKHLITMTSGLSWNDNINYYQMDGTSDWVKYVLDRPMEHQPGTVWNYNSGGSHVLSAILDQVTPNGTRAYAEAKIFDPLNINYKWYTDNQGIPNGGTLLHLTPRAMAKFGFLYLNNGYWNGTQLIPSEWIAESITPFMNVEFDQGEGSGYGYKWWIYRWFNAYTARGSNDQVIAVIPDLNSIVIFTGNREFQYIRLLVDYIFPSVGFYPLDLDGVLVLVISLSIISGSLCLMFYRIQKKRTLQKIKDEYYNAINTES